MFVALKPCRFGDSHEYLIGDLIPDDIISPDSVKRLTKLGMIAQGSEAAEAADREKITVNIRSESGNVPLYLDGEDIPVIFDVLQATAEEAKAIIERMENPEALAIIMSSSIESRKTVRETAEKRAQELLSDSDGKGAREEEKSDSGDAEGKGDA